MFHQTSPDAIAFLDELFNQYGTEFSIKIELTQPGTIQATVSLVFEQTKLLEIDNRFTAEPIGKGQIFWRSDQQCFLKDIKIGFKLNPLGGELELDIPGLRGIPADLSLHDRIALYFAQEIQPALDMHRGHAKVCEVTKEYDLVIEFSGGCQGCSQAPITLKHMIVQKVQQNFPQIRTVIDKTEHQKGDRPYA